MKITQYIYDFHQINKQHVKFHLQPKKTKPTASPGDAQIDVHSLYTLGDLIRTWVKLGLCIFAYIFIKKKEKQKKPQVTHLCVCEQPSQLLLLMLNSCTHCLNSESFSY